jgi:dihydrofolate synthase/folylpolyglutamate synthase
MDERAQLVISDIAARRGAQLVRAADNVSIATGRVTLAGRKCRVESSALSYGTLTLPLAGIHQLENLAVAVTVCEQVAVMTGMDSDPSRFAKGFESTVWPARFQVLGDSPPVILDAAHNEAAMRMLIKSLQEIMPGGKIGLVLGVCSDKDISGIVKHLAPAVARVWAVPVPDQRGMDNSELAALVAREGITSEATDLDNAVEAARQWALDDDGVACICGSLFLAGEVLSRLEKGML